MPEIKIGETFEYKGKKVRCKVGQMSNCLQCALLEEDECWKYPCTPAGRTDARIVYFEEVKDGRN